MTIYFIKSPLGFGRRVGLKSQAKGQTFRLVPGPWGDVEFAWRESFVELASTGGEVRASLVLAPELDTDNHYKDAFAIKSMAHRENLPDFWFVRSGRYFLASKRFLAVADEFFQIELQKWPVEIFTHRGEDANVDGEFVWCFVRNRVVLHVGSSGWIADSDADMHAYVAQGLLAEPPGNIAANEIISAIIEYPEIHELLQDTPLFGNSYHDGHLFCNFAFLDAARKAGLTICVQLRRRR